MITHPDASDIIKPRESTETYQQLHKEFESRMETFKRFKTSEAFKEVEDRFSIPEQAILPEHLFTDPFLFKDWGSSERQKIYRKKNDDASLLPSGDIRVQKSQTPKASGELDTDTATPELEIDNSVEQPKREPIQVGDFFIPPVPEPVDLNKLLGPDLDLSTRSYNFDRILDDSNLHFVNSSCRTSFQSYRRTQINFVGLSQENNCRNDEQRLLTEKDIIYQVTVYPSNQKPRKIMQEYKVLGSQKLNSLRDAIFCIEDFLSYSDPDKQLEAERKVREFSCKGMPATVVDVRPTNQLNTLDRKISSSFFFFEDNFYIDCRAENAEDYSHTIIKWAKSSSSSKGRFHGFNDLKTFDMDSVTFDELPIRLNQPYLFCHQGDCNHIIIISQVRHFHPRLDVPEYCLYPFKTFSDKIHIKKCSTCDVYQAKHIIVNDMHAGENPLLQCDDCYNLFHFDASGNPIYTICRYPYSHC